MDIVPTLSVISPLLVIVLCTAYFVFEVTRMRIPFAAATARFVWRIVVFACVALAVVIAIVFAYTFAYDAAQAPLGLVFYGPWAASCGLIVGTIMWRRHEMKLRTK
jgi:anti-sigma-K factor RskA